MSRAKSIDGILSNTYPLSSVVKYAHRTDIIYYKIIIDLTKNGIDLPDTLNIWLLTKYLFDFLERAGGKLLQSLIREKRTFLAENLK